VTEDVWPALSYGEWKETYATLHMWSQIVGKIALAQAPPMNHGWGVSFSVTARGLATHTLPHGNRSFTIELDFIDHQLVIQASNGARRTLALEPRSVADFHRALMSTLDEMDLPVKIWTVPVEIPAPIRFEDDTIHHAYDPAAANRIWRVLVQVDRVFGASRCEFIGKCSPVQFFWGSFDLAVTRFSGRAAPPREGPAFMRDAYSHEVISHGFWPGGPTIEASFYAYAAPEPNGLKDAPVRPDAASYNRELNEFILPYEAVRQWASPDGAILAFIDSTYAAAAKLGGWDRAALERTPQPSR
jgi:hypothetical protein